MTALDTKVIVRYVVRDDACQTVVATRLTEAECTGSEPGVVTLVVLSELVWVLDRGYGYAHAEYSNGKADFADYVIGLSGRPQKATGMHSGPSHRQPAAGNLGTPGSFQPMACAPAVLFANGFE